MGEFIKPDCQLIGEDGNTMSLLAIASRALKGAGYNSKASEMRERVFKAGSYDEALNIIQEYVNAS